MELNIIKPFVTKDINYKIESFWIPFKNDTVTQRQVKFRKNIFEKMDDLSGMNPPEIIPFYDFLIGNNKLQDREKGVA